MTLDRLRRRASLMLDLFSIRRPEESVGDAPELANFIGRDELAVRERADGTYEALNDEALMRLIHAWSPTVPVVLVAVAVLSEVEGDQYAWGFVPRFEVGGGYVFLELTSGAPRAAN